ncbi:hypothetical protein HK101_003033 [Irineochytrium annulatum]|nr:hypothetical protein HK101_003033 [Irineochytrium annulatum]
MTPHSTLTDQVTVLSSLRHREQHTTLSTELGRRHNSPSSHLRLPLSTTTSLTITSTHRAPTFSPPVTLPDFYAAEAREEAETLADQKAVGLAWRSRDAAALHSKCDAQNEMGVGASLIPGLDPHCARTVVRLQAMRSLLKARL